MSYVILTTETFDTWVHALTLAERISVRSIIDLLEDKGVTLGYPYSSAVFGSRHGHMRELRIQHKGRPIRVLYAFDPKRSAVLLLGGHKGGDDLWYERNIPLADKLYDQHMTNLKRQGDRK
jgi:hypothetical protein